MEQFSIVQKIIIFAIPLLFAITLHEVAHGAVANRLGDPTAKLAGRLTLNPINHIDLFGTILVPLLMLVLSAFTFAFGWAKPVPVNFNNLKKPRRDMALVALAGPMANFLMAIFWAMMAKVGRLAAQDTMYGKVLFVMGIAGIIINLLLMVLNLLPIPPLDGSRVLASVSPPWFVRVLNRIEPFGIFILIALLFAGVLGTVIKPAVAALYQFIIAILL